MRKLSDYLKRIEKSFNLYSEYFKWKKTSEIIIDDININEKIECEICEKLNEQEWIGNYQIEVNMSLKVCIAF